MQIEVRKADMGKEKKRLKVCAYARVSTEASEQENSLENQVSHYTEMIQSNPAYEFAGVYADFGISGFKESRPQFQKMMQDAKNGKIDLIITKSVSRFARNTAIVLKASRELKARNVGIFFELQNINTLTEAGELLLTILAAFAQAESESASESSKMAYLHRIENGEVVAYLERSYGYEKDENGEYRAKEPEASVIREIYDLVIQGVNCTNIARVLNARNIQTVQGAEWTASTVFRIVENEIYKGDVLMQKTFIDEVQQRGILRSHHLRGTYEDRAGGTRRKESGELPSARVYLLPLCRGCGKEHLQGKKLQPLCCGQGSDPDCSPPALPAVYVRGYGTQPCALYGRCASW